MKLFEQGNIGRLRIKNRIVMAAMGNFGLTEPDGRFSERAIDYYVARAKGGVGLITTGVCFVDNKIEKHLDGAWSTFPRLDSAVYVPRISELADAVHDHGAKLCLQLTPGFGRVISRRLLTEEPPVSASALPCFAAPEIVTRELTAEEVQALVKAFGISARFAEQAGVDAVEVHAHHGYLLDQFMTSLWNHRTDQYGGDIENRLRFAVEIVKAVKKRTADMPIIFRFSGKHYVKEGRDIGESCEIARHLEASGVDALHIDAGCYEAYYWGHPSTYQEPGSLVGLAEAIKKVVRIPVIAVGKLGYPGLAEQVLRDGKADFIALGRGLLADPEWPNKAREGRLDDLRPCIGDNEGCLMRGSVEGKYVSCTVNPTTGIERELAIQPSTRQKRVLIIGGGPAGMEAARVAALRGHQVTLWEKTSQLGGNLIPAAVPFFKKDLALLMAYLSNQVRKLGVSLELEKEATPEIVLEADPEAVIVATGSVQGIPELAGVENDIVVGAIDLLLGRKKPGRDVIVIGGSLVGCETAAYLAGKGSTVTIVEMTHELLPDAFFANRGYLLNMLREKNVAVTTDTRVSQVVEDGVVTESAGGRKEGYLKCDTVVLATGLRSNAQILDELQGKVAELYAIGDCVRPRRIINAIWEGFRTARLI